ncbi:hypothetical protein HDU76_009351 [Blyttiomyces sp. JEL0837]|nr:hypothetical protein HDU76_009351 [Blyttiomyces sp. JEL0837]
MGERRPNVKTFEVPYDLHGIHLEKFVSQEGGMRRSQARLKILNGEVEVIDSTHSKFVKINPNSLLNAGDTVKMVLRGKPTFKVWKSEDDDEKMAKEAARVQHEVGDHMSFLRFAVALSDRSLTSKAELDELKKRILYKDQHIIILNKPAGLAIQGGSKVKKSLSSYLDGLKFSKEETPRIVHRLDKDTTGALILARTKPAATKINELFQSDEKPVTKKYYAVVMSPLPEPSGYIKTGIVQHGEAPNEKIVAVEWFDSDEQRQPEPGEPAIKKAETLYKTIAAKKYVG